MRKAFLHQWLEYGLFQNLLRQFANHVKQDEVLTSHLMPYPPLYVLAELESVCLYLYCLKTFYRENLELYYSYNYQKKKE